MTYIGSSRYINIKRQITSFASVSYVSDSAVSYDAIFEIVLLAYSNNTSTTIIKYWKYQSQLRSTYMSNLLKLLQY